ncbi:anti-sigma regulatory factor [Saccharothrix sp. ALI-22-I]|uniref:sensor histidine kinase n=1 Tax=Saccharothrix sp. ALI-22-I TaxID=1933778 RepID=UPI00097BFD0E|nr:sensor histidine kinase [Saccharothrix sp. ALI-22-I]ONI92101.1 anti-sigma regulatory factor [Saccharothrix sp. ALI-22-I]
MTTTTPTGQDPFVHPALFYRSATEYLDALVPFITDGLAARQPVAVAVPGPNLRLLTSALGEAAEQLYMLDMTVAGRNPGRIIPGVLRRFADTHVDRHVRIIGEPIWPARSATEYPACAQHEALINLAFAGRDVTIVCPYDTEGLDAEALADARATHPLVWEADRRYASADYAPDHVVARYNQPLNHSEGAEVHLVSTANDLSPARRRIADHARTLGLKPDRIADLELIATELATNSLIHAGAPCELRIWRDNGHVICEARNTGQLTDPLVGRRPATPHTFSGRGLLVINNLADLVRTHTSPNETTIRAYLRAERQSVEPIIPAATKH